MEIAVVRHVPFEDLGHIGPVLIGREHRLRYMEMGDPVALVGADALILMGGPMSANDPEPWVSRELAAIEQAMNDGIPVLGICLGAQLIAKALGSRVYRNTSKEVGWFPVHWRREAASDALFESMVGSETVFHWHGETFDLPRNAAWLAYSDRCAHQAFRYGDNVYGLQFHPEVTPEMVADWCRQDANCGDVRELDAPIDLHCNATRQEELAKLLFGRWSDRILCRNRAA